MKAGASAPAPRSPGSGTGLGAGGEDRQGVLKTFGGAEMIGQQKMIKYLKIKTEKGCPPTPSTQAKQVCFETLNMLNIKIVALFLFKCLGKSSFPYFK